MLEQLGLSNARHYGNFYDLLKNQLSSCLNYKQKNIFKVIDTKRATLLSKYNSCSHLQAVVVGAGPIGLRAAIEMALLGAQVTVIERRPNFTRHNILHLWDWICADLLQLGASGAEILGKSFFHIGTKSLQLILARLVLVLGAPILTGLEAVDLREPDLVRWKENEGLGGVGGVLKMQREKKKKKKKKEKNDLHFMLPSPPLLPLSHTLRNCFHRAERSE